MFSINVSMQMKANEPMLHFQLQIMLWTGPLDLANLMHQQLQQKLGMFLVLNGVGGITTFIKWQVWIPCKIAISSVPRGFATAPALPLEMIALSLLLNYQYIFHVINMVIVMEIKFLWSMKVIIKPFKVQRSLKKPTRQLTLKGKLSLFSRQITILHLR